jgi:kinesin family protein 5
LIITCSQEKTNLQETISTLRFGSRAKSIKNRPKINKEYTIEELKQLIIEKDLEIKLL